MVISWEILSWAIQGSSQIHEWLRLIRGESIVQNFATVEVSRLENIEFADIKLQVKHININGLSLGWVCYLIVKFTLTLSTRCHIRVLIALSALVCWFTEVASSRAFSTSLSWIVVVRPIHRAIAHALLVNRIVVLWAGATPDWIILLACGCTIWLRNFCETILAGQAIGRRAQASCTNWIAHLVADNPTRAGRRTGSKARWAWQTRLLKSWLVSTCRAMAFRCTGNTQQLLQLAIRYAGNVTFNYAEIA